MLLFALIMQSELERFEETLVAKMGAFDVELAPDALARLRAFYSLLTRWNDRLHLVAPCAPEEFATRHVLESLLLLKHLPPGAKIADIGSGAGLPIIPCLIVRDDLEATLIESSQKKTMFLREALSAVGRRATIVARRFEDVAAPNVEFVTSRALDQFIRKIPVLIDWAPDGSTLLFFGGEALRKQLKAHEEFLVPGSEKRYLFRTGIKHGLKTGST
jgi:16S rRNA (guanine527-N7)-methyltransferase